MSLTFLSCITGSIFPNRCYNINTFTHLPNLSLSKTWRSFSSFVIISSNKLLAFVTGSLSLTPHFEPIHPIPFSSVLQVTHFNCPQLTIIWKLTSTCLLLVPFQNGPWKKIHPKYDLLSSQYFSFQHCFLSLSLWAIDFTGHTIFPKFSHTPTFEQQSWFQSSFEIYQQTKNNFSLTMLKTNCQKKKVKYKKHYS